MNNLDINILQRNISSKIVKITTFDEIDSTNEQCKRDILGNRININIANKQTQGRGRRGKSWSSPDSGNIYMSLSKVNLTKQDFPLSLSVGLICQSAIQSFLTEEKIKLKWPNDILINNKKIGGILVEQEFFGSNVLSIIGIGINLNIAKKEDWWGDLSEFSSLIKREELINKIILKVLDFFENGIDNSVSQWEDICMHMNKEINIIQANKVIDKGIFKGINEDGSMNISNKNGKKTYLFGEVSIKGIY